MLNSFFDKVERGVSKSREERRTVICSPGSKTSREAYKRKAEMEHEKQLEIARASAPIIIINNTTPESNNTEISKNIDEIKYLLNKLFN